MDDLPSEFDVVVIGTGLAESILSAAAARVGHSVLHLDPRDYYGGKWTTINFEALEVGSFASDPQNVQEQSDLLWKNSIRDFEPVWYVESEDLKRSLREVSRKFNVDVYPKVLLAREEIIQLLIDSNVSRYLEFKCIQKLYASLPQESIVEPIPLSRSDIFTTKSLGLVEKRKLTKFIELVLKEDEESEGQLRSFDQLVEQSKVNDKIQHLLKQAVKTVEDELDPGKLNSDFVERCKVFLRSIGRYGNQTPYLWTLYGVGEICQAFCRLSAIYGGIFILKKSVSKVKVESDRVIVTSNGKEIAAKHLILGPELIYKSEQLKPEKMSSARRIFRGILIVQGGSLRGPVEVSEENENQSEMAVYKIGPFEVIDLDHSSLAVPKPFRLIQVTGPPEESSSPRAAIETALSGYLDFSGNYQPEEGNQNVESPANTCQDTEKVEEKTDPGVSKTDVGSKPDLASKPLVLFASYFSVASRKASETSERIWDCATNSTEITSEILRAREIFSSMYPDDEFLPKASDGTDAEEPIDEIVKEFQAQTLNANLEDSTDETVQELAQDVTETAPPSEST